MFDQLIQWLEKSWAVLTFSAFKIGQKDISLFLIGEILVLLILGFLFAKLLTRFLQTRLAKTRLDEGIQYTIIRLIRYSIAGIVFYQAISMLGINLTGLAFFAGIISVGIGFGLQNIANNFVSGLILLFERPIKPGDMVTVGDTDGRVTDIKMRATTVVTRDNVVILVPNSQFVSEEVTNWSHTDPKVRIHVPVGVAYGSDVKLVTELLLQVAKDHSQVIDEPTPNVWFTGFGDSSLNFELLVWIANPLLRKPIQSELNYAIDAIFREHNVTIPFPQRDLHLQSLPSTIETKFLQ